MLLVAACGGDEAPTAMSAPPTAAPTNTIAPSATTIQEATPTAALEAAPLQPDSPLSAPESPLATPVTDNAQGVAKSGDAAAAVSEDTVSKPDDEHCAAKRIHPQSREFAEQFKVTAEEINAWFCQGIGFGELRNAYTISLEASQPVTDVLQLFLAGVEWGDIRSQLGLPPGEEDAQGND